MSNFEWHTEDEHDWDEKPQPQIPKSRRRWLIPLAIFILIGIVGLTVYRQVQEVVEATEQTTEQQIRGAFTTLYLASAEKDRELFISLLSGRDPRWTDQQRQQFTNSTLLDRSSLGLTLLDTQPTIASIELDPDLTSATVIANAQYAVQGNDGLTETIPLAIPTVYRLGDNQWLYAPPLPDFWGATVEEQTDNLQLFFPERDAEVMGQIGRDLDTIFTTLCRINAQSPCATPRRQIQFVTDPTAITLPDPLPLGKMANEPTPTFILPTPSLVGLPQDDTGYPALLAGYARQIFRPIIAEMSGYTCCEQQMYMDALINVQLREAGVMGWPLSQDDYAETLRQRSYVEDRFWQNVRPQDVTALIEFLTQTYQISMREWVAEFQPTGSCNCPINNLNNLTLRQDEEEPSWEVAAGQSSVFGRFLFERSGNTIPSDLDRPTSNIVFGCQDADDETSFLLRYNLAQASFERFADSPSYYVRLVQLADDSALWVERGYGHANVYQDGTFTPIHGEMISFSYFKPNSTEALAFDESSDLLFKLVETQNCNGNCPTTTLPGFPVWSPDGKHAIMIDFANGQFYSLHDERGLIRNVTQNDQSFEAVFWLDNERFVVTDGLNFYVQSITDGTLELWLSPEDFFPFLGEDALDARISDNSPFGVQRIGDAVIMSVFIPRTNRSEYQLLILDLETRQMRLVEELAGFSDWIGLRNDQNQFATLYDHSFDGRYTITFLDIQTAMTFTVPAYYDFFPINEAWHGDWVLVMDEGFGRIIHPATQTVEYIFPPAHCTSGAWYSGE